MDKYKIPTVHGTVVYIMAGIPGHHISLLAKVDASSPSASDSLRGNTGTV